MLGAAFASPLLHGNPPFANCWATSQFAAELPTLESRVGVDFAVAVLALEATTMAKRPLADGLACEAGSCGDADGVCPGASGVATAALAKKTTDNSAQARAARVVIDMASPFEDGNREEAIEAPQAALAVAHKDGETGGT